MRYLELPVVSVGGQKARIVSVDALRGFNMFWIIGGDGAVWALAQMLRGKGVVLNGTGTFLYTQMTHVAWDGFRFYDLIFPLFVFVTGVSIVLSLPRLVEHEGARAAHIRVLRRTLLLYVLGLIYYGGISQHWSDIRFLGVLQRIAICYGVASLLLLHLNVRGIVATCAALLLGYWALMALVPVPGIGTGSFGPDANLANWIDAHYLPGRLWDKTRDPEGLLSTLPAIATCLLGVLAGLFLRSENFTPQQKSLWLVLAGAVTACVGYAWGLQFPIVKMIWTSSFVLVAGGYSLIVLGAMHHIVDVWGFKRWTVIFGWIGANAITLYFLNEVVNFRQFAARFVGGDAGRLLDQLVTPGAGRFATYGLGLVFAVELAGYLYRRKIFLRV
jgi:predicted acyltransferase